MKRLTKLTDAQREAIPAHVAKWIAAGQATGDPDWAAVEAGIEACYRYAGLAWHQRVVRVPNPLVLALAAPTAARRLVGAQTEPSNAVRDAVRGPVGDTVGVAVHGAVGDAVHGAVGDAVHGAVDDAVHGAVGGPVGVAVNGAVGDAVHGAVHGVVRGAEWWRRFGGQWWASWQARASYYRDICGLELPGDLWDRDRAYAAAQSAGWWWPHRDFVMISNRPRELHIERVGPDGWGSHRMHRDGGPAISWDGWALHYWHGVQVPADLVEGDGWAPDRVLAEPNTEIRRCAIEKRGWDRFIGDSGMRQVGDTVPDPGNLSGGGGELALYELPPKLQDIYGEPVRILLVRNGTPELDGSWRRFGLTVPADLADPVEAAAWGYDDPDSPVRMTSSMYRMLARRT